MKYDISNLDNVKILDRICSVYGFHQKVQLANHFGIAASSLTNRYTRGNVSYDFAALCSLETGASLHWILTGEGENTTGEKRVSNDQSEFSTLEKFTLSESKLVRNGTFNIDCAVLSKTSAHVFCVEAESGLNILEETSAVSDGLKLVDIDGAVSIREIAMLPGKKLHVTGGKIPFECSVSDVQILGRVIGVYCEVK